MAGGASVSLVPVRCWRTHHIPHLTDMHLCLSIPLDPAPPLPFLEPLVIWLFPGAPQILPLCLSSDQLFPCSGLREKEGHVSPCPTTTLAAPAAGWTLPGTKANVGSSGEGARTHQSQRQEPELKRRDGHCCVLVVGILPEG